METNNKGKLLVLIENLVTGKASIQEIKALFNFFQSHQEITTWQDDFENKNDVETKIFNNIQKKANLGTYKKTKVISLFRKNLLKYAAVIMLGGFISFIYFQPKRSTVPDETKIVDNHIQIGSDKATLTLEDGTSIPLEKGSSFKTQNAQSNGEKLVYDTNSTESKETAVVYNYLTIPRGGQFFIKLSDGTQVWLNSESKLKYPVNFVDGRPRVVELVYGEAYFEVSPSTEHAGSKFQVFNGDQEIEVLGTEFNVKAYRDDSEVYTTLVKGKVALTYSTNTAKKELKPNHQSVYNPTTNSVTVSEVIVFNEISWRKGVFSFEDTSLKDIMKVLSRWYDMDVEFKNHDIESAEFIGVLSKKQNMEDILNTIKSFGIISDYNIENKHVILK